MSFSNNELSRLRWACRRGMLELDLLLLPFFEHRFLQLNPIEQKNFIDFLSCTDQELYDWLMSKQVSNNASFQNIVLLIQQYAQSAA
jgi:antitoxin CptB